MNLIQLKQEVPAREQLTPNFYRDEFACHCGCGFDAISLLVVDRLQQVRDEIDNPLKITSGCRCASHNKAVGGVEDSAHLKGFAVDISCTHPFKRKTLVQSLCRVFPRILIYKTFIHADTDPNKMQDILEVMV